MGHSRGGFSTKLHGITDAKGRPLFVTLTQGHRHEMIVAHELLEHAPAKTSALIADAGYDSNDFVKAIRKRKMKVVICMNPTRKKGRRRTDKKLYRTRYRVECMFHGLKRFRAVATRYDKLQHTYLAMVHIACALLWLA